MKKNTTKKSIRDVPVPDLVGIRRRFDETGRIFSRWASAHEIKTDVIRQFMIGNMQPKGHWPSPMFDHIVSCLKHDGLWCELGKLEEKKAA